MGSKILWIWTYFFQLDISWIKVEEILKGSLDLIPSPSVKIQIMDGKVCLRCKGKTLLGVVNKLLKIKSLLTMPSNVLPLHLKQTFLPIIWIFTEGKIDGIKFRLPFKIYSTFTRKINKHSLVTIWIHLHMFFDPIVVELNMPTSALVLKKNPKAWHCIGIIIHSNSKEQGVL